MWLQDYVDANETALPSPEDLKYKILIKNKKNIKKQDNDEFVKKSLCFATVIDENVCSDTGVSSYSVMDPAEMDEEEFDADYLSMKFMCFFKSLSLSHNIINRSFEGSDAPTDVVCPSFDQADHQFI